MKELCAGLLEDLQDLMTKDPDAQVVANCMSVLQQVRLSHQLGSHFDRIIFLPQPNDTN